MKNRVLPADVFITGPARVLQGNVVIDDYGVPWVFGPQEDQGGQTKIVAIGDLSPGRGIHVDTFQEGIEWLIYSGYIDSLEIEGYEHDI